MNTLKITKQVNLPLLTEELFNTFPQWRQLGEFGMRTDVILTRESIEFPDDTEVSAVQAVIDAHDLNGQSINQQEAIKEDAAKNEFDGMPPWLKDATYSGVEQAIRDRTVGDVTKEQALAAIDAAANLADVKIILARLVNIVYGLVDVNQKIARVVLAVVFFVKRRQR